MKKMDIKKIIKKINSNKIRHDRALTIEEHNFFMLTNFGEVI